MYRGYRIALIFICQIAHSYFCVVWLKTVICFRQLSPFFFFFFATPFTIWFRGALTYESDVRVPPSTSEGSFSDKLCQKRGSFSDKVHKKRGFFSEMHQKIGAFRAWKWAKISQHFVKFVEIFKKSNFLAENCHLTIKCKNGGLWVSKMCQGLSVTRSLLKIGGHWVKVGKNGGLSVKASEKK